LGVVVVLGSRLWAQQGGQPAPVQPPKTRIALVNLPHVIKSYQKYQTFEREWQETYKTFDKQYESKRVLLQQWQAEAAKTPEGAAREKAEANVRQLQREMQDMGEEAKKQLGKKRDDQAVIIYKEIEEAVQVYARARDIDLVLHFNDNIVPADMYSPMNVQRKLQLGACFPMYHAPGMDITEYIVQMLNQRYQTMMNQPAPGGAAPAAKQ
jgi:Skp family chaperone for outer membrane proteins